MPPKKDAKKDIVVKEDNSGLPKNDVTFRFEFEVKQTAIQNIVLMWEWFSSNSSNTERYDAQLIENWTPKDPSDPSVLTFSRDIDPIRVDDDFCKLITKKEFYLYFVNSEDSKIKHEFSFDYSSLLSQTSDNPKFEYSNNKILVIEIEDFKMTLKADKILLLPLYRHYLNPLEIEVIGAKDLPVDSDKQYEPCYVQYTFFDGTQTKTPSKLQKNTIKWGSKHVFLCGLLDQVSIVEKISTHFLKMEVHDKDERLDNKVKQELPLMDVDGKIKEYLEKNKPPEEEIVDPKGKKGGKAPPPAAKKEAPKKEPPKKDAKKDTKKKGGSFKMPEKPIEPVVEEKSAAANKKGTKAPPPPVPAAAAKKEAPKVEEIKIEKKDDPPIFEKAVYFMPYKSEEFVKNLQDAFYTINMEAAKAEQGGRRAISTKKLTPEERKNRTFDFLGGFEIIDDDFRLFVIEGLSAGAMKRLEELIPRSEPNSEMFKILKNSDELFQERAYLDFDLELKRIRLREKLKDILVKPDIYIRTKEPENICRTLNQISEISKCWNVKNVAQFDLFPSAANLIAMERKYSDALTSEDIYGEPQEVKKSKNRKKISSFQDISKDSKTNMTLSSNTQNFLPKVDNFTSRQLDVTSSTKQVNTITNTISNNNNNNPQNGQTDHSLIQITEHKSEKKRLTYSAKPKNDPNINQIRIKSALPQTTEEVYIYGGQHNNWYEKKKREQREMIRKDEQNFYTYSEQYLTLAIDPYNVEDENKLAETVEKTKLSQKPPFRAVPKKTKEERDNHPKKPTSSKAQEMAQYPYFKQHEVELNALKNTRGEPTRGKEDFNGNIHPVTFFSSPEVLEAEKIKPVEKERQEREKKKQETLEWESKFKGSKYLYVKNNVQEHPSQIDKLKNLREGSAKKKGLLLKNSRLKETTLHMDRQLKDLPCTIFLEEPYVEKYDFFERKPEPEKCLSNRDFDRFLNPEVLTKSTLSKPLKLDPMYKSSTMISNDNGARAAASKRRTNRKADSKDNDQKLKEAEEKFNEAKKMITRDKKTSGDCEKANILLSDGLKLLQAIPSQSESSQSKYFHLKGQAYIGMKQFQKALFDFDTAVKQEADNPIYHASRGNCHLQLGNVQEALTEFDQTIKLNPTDGTNYMIRAKIYFSLEQYQVKRRQTCLENMYVSKSIEDYTMAQKFMKESNSLFKIYYSLGKCYCRIKQLDDAIHFLEKATLIKKENSKAQNTLGLSLFDAGRYAEALDKFQEARNLDDSKAEYYANKSLALYHLKDYKKSIDECGLAIKIDPSLSRNYYIRGNSYLALKKYEEAHRDFDEAIRLNASNEMYYHSKGLTFHEQKEYEKAIKMFKKALSIKEDHIPSRYNLGLMQHLHGDLHEALINFGIVLESKGDDRQVYESRGKVHQDLLQYQQSISDFNQAIRLDPSIPEAYYYRGLSLIELGKIKQALTDFTLSLQLGIKSPSIFSGMAQAYRQLENYDKALFYINQALELSKQNVDFLLQRSNIYVDTKEYLKAIDDLTVALKHAESDPVVLYKRGIAFFKNCSYKSCIRDLFRSYEHKASSNYEADLHYHLGIAFSNLKSFALSIDPFCEAIKLMPQHAHYIHERAKSYLLVGEYEKSLTDYNTVIDMQPSNSNAHFGRAFAHKGLQHFEESANDFNLACTLNPTNSMILVNFRNLNQIQFIPLCKPGEEERMPE